MTGPAERTPADIADELCRAVQDGVPGAWDRLVEQYGRLVLAIPRELGLPEEDCEDVFQTTWLALFRELSGIKRPGALTKWIATTARRHAWRALERRRRDGPLGGAESGPSAEAARPDADLASVELRHAVHEGLEQLSPRCRTLLQSLFLDPRERSYAELARDLGMAEGSLGPGRMRCLADLARVLERTGLFR